MSRKWTRSDKVIHKDTSANIAQRSLEIQQPANQQIHCQMRCKTYPLDWVYLYLSPRLELSSINSPHSKSVYPTFGRSDTLIICECDHVVLPIKKELNWIFGNFRQTKLSRILNSSNRVALVLEWERQTLKVQIGIHKITNNCSWNCTLSGLLEQFQSWSEDDLHSRCVLMSLIWVQEELAD